MEEQGRKNLQDAFGGDPDPLSEGAHADPLSQEAHNESEAAEAVEFRIKSGILRTQVSAGTSTEDVLGPDRFYEAELILEDDTRVSIIISQGSEGVDVMVNKETAPGLSGVTAKTADSGSSAPTGSVA